MAKMLYALVDGAGVMVREPRSFEKRPDDLSQKGWRWLPVEDVPPDHDPATERVAFASWLIQPDKAVKVYEVAAKPASVKSIEERVAALEAKAK